MKTKNKLAFYSTLLISTLGVVLLVNTIVKACGGDGLTWRDQPEVFLQPNLEPSKARFEPFYYTIDFYNWSQKESELAPVDFSATDENTQIWFNHFMGKINKASIYDFLYNSPTYVCDEKPQLDDFIKVFEGSPFIAFLNQNKDRKALQYFMLAKANEFGTGILDNGWNYFNEYDAYGTENIKGAVASTKLLPFLTNALTQEKDFFYKQRLAFQLIRYSRYNYVPHVCDSLYKIYFDSAQSSELKYAALNYAIDALVNEGEQKKANYYAALLFDKSEEKQERAFNNFSQALPVEVVLPYCRSKQEQAMVYALYAFKDFYFNAAYIEKAVALDPQNTSINDLLIREINKSEYTLMPVLNGYYSYLNRPADEQANLYNEEGVMIRTYASLNENAPKLVSLLQDLQAVNPIHKEFYQLCLAHLQVILGNYSQAKNNLNAIQAASLPEKMRLQFHLTSAILQIKSADFKNKDNLNFLAQKFEFLNENREKYYYHEFLLNGLKLMAVGELLKQKDVAHAYLLAEEVETIFDSYTFFTYHIRPQDIDDILAIQNNPIGAFEKQLVKENKLSKNELRDIQGCLYLREQNIVMANKCFAMDDNTFIPINFTTLNTNPDGHPCHPGDYSIIPEDQQQYYTPEQVKFHNERAKRLTLEYNHYSITKTMLDLEKSIKQKKGNLAQNYYNLACLYMEISFYGRAYTAMQFSGGWSWSEIEYYGEDLDKVPFAKHYYGSEWAIPYLEMALKHSKNKELSAKCLYALFRCNRHLQEVMDNKIPSKDLAYLFQLHDKYANTDYYKIKECWGLTAYVNELRSGNNKTSKE